MEISGLLAPAKLAVLLHRRRDLLGDTKDRCSKLVVGLDSGAQYHFEIGGGKRIYQHLSA